MSSLAVSMLLVLAICIVILCGYCACALSEVRENAHITKNKTNGFIDLVNSDNLIKKDLIEMCTKSSIKANEAEAEKCGLLVKNAALTAENNHLKPFANEYLNHGADTVIITFKGEHYHITDVQLNQNEHEATRISVDAVRIAPTGVEKEK